MDWRPGKSCRAVVVQLAEDHEVRAFRPAPSDGKPELRFCSHQFLGSRRGRIGETKSNEYSFGLVPDSLQGW